MGELVISDRAAVWPGAAESGPQRVVPAPPWRQAGVRLPPGAHAGRVVPGRRQAPL